MEKFSLYDFLGLLLPGVIFLYFFNLLNNLFEFKLLPIITTNLEADIVILLCFAIIIGAVLYASSFYLVNKTKWYNHLFGMYRHVADLYLEIHFPPSMSKVLNRKAVEWYERNIFFNKTDFNKKPASEQQEIKNLQDDFYNRIYYELEYLGKNEHSKAFHSFYFFFRQTALSCLLLLLTDILLFIFFWIRTDALLSVNSTIFGITGVLFLLLIVSVMLARWYRKRMVMKIYWTYYTHLQLTTN